MALEITHTKRITLEHNLFKINVNKKNFGNIDIYLVESPTGNCQLVSIVYACHVVHPSFTVLERMEVLSYILRKCCTKAQVLVDLNTIHVNPFIDVISKESIVIQQEYKSTNNSVMTLIIFRVSTALAHINPLITQMIKTT